MNRWGLLLVNLGTPDAPDTPAVRRYLREFLSDPRVLDVGAVTRAFVLNLLILPFRPRQSAEAYRKVWTERGSPLLFHGLDLVEKVRSLVGDATQVELAMRYQNPSVTVALERFRAAGIDRIVVFPLFPQYSSSAFGSAVEEVFRVASRLWNVPTLQVVPPFYDHPEFVESFAAVAKPHLGKFQPDKVVMSFHGLPERQVVKSDESGSHCLRSLTCCDEIVSANRNCYRAQCFATARSLAAHLELEPERYEVTFQSRLGRRTPWISPYTDHRIVELPQEGVRRVAVMCPAFVADCLETLEEIGLRASDDFRSAGGEELSLVPSLNSDDRWAEAVVRIGRESSASGAV